MPVGFVIAALPAVTKVLHSDRRLELYRLTPAVDEQVLLLANDVGFPLDASRLQQWLSVQSQNILKGTQMLQEGEAPAGMLGAAITLRGHYLADSNLAAAPETSLRSLLSAMLDAVDTARSARMFPDFQPFLTWLSLDARDVCCLMPLGEEAVETEQVRLLARAFFRFASGVDPSQVEGKAPSLQSWSKYAGDDLSRIINRCLNPANAKDGISSLGGLRTALGIPAVADASSRVAGVPRTGADALSPPSADGRGLQKVAGMHSLKELLLREVVAPVRNPEPYKRYGLSIPNGILLYGPPGCGKTYIARQLAEELEHYFVEVIPSELASPYIHQSVMRIRDLFDTAAEHAPSVMFIDEFEAMVPERGDLGGLQQYKAEEVNEFLAHLNSCSDKGIFVIAATNQPSKIDSAVRRTGRLDKLIYVGPPDLEARHEMIALHLAGRPVAATLDLQPLSLALSGYSASDLRFLVDEAARDAFRRGQEIDDEAFASAMAHIRPSVTLEIEESYRTVQQRG